MPHVKITPSALAILRAGADIYESSAQHPGVEHADLWASLGAAAEHLGAPASTERQAANALEAALAADDEYRAWSAALDAETRRRLDLDAWLADVAATR